MPIELLFQFLKALLTVIPLMGLMQHKSVYRFLKKLLPCNLPLNVKEIALQAIQ